MNNLRNKKPLGDLLLQRASSLLVVIVWLSAILFGLFILAFYAFSLITDDFSNWNKVLPDLYDPAHKMATFSIGIHFLCGGIILVLGCIQVMKRIRDAYPVFHRWVGRVYVLASIVAALGGLSFIFLKGTVGGTPMDLGFGLYGVIMLVTAILTIYFARLKQFNQHRAWALRLFAVAIGSWLYRMEYGFWYMLFDGYGSTRDLTGPFDVIMNFFFYIPNLLVAEIIIGNLKVFKSNGMKIFGSVILFCASLFILVGTYYFTKHLWGPGIMAVFE